MESRGSLAEIPELTGTGGGWGRRRGAGAKKGFLKRWRTPGGTGSERIEVEWAVYLLEEGSRRLGGGGVRRLNGGWPILPSPLQL